METKLEYLLDSGNTLNMFETQKYWNKIFQKDEYFHFQITPLNIGPILHCRIGNDTLFRFVSAKLVYFSDLLDFKYAYLCK